MNSATHSVNSNSPFELRGQQLPADSVVPVEPDAWRRACPVRRRLVSVIPSRCDIPVSNQEGVILTFDPMWGPAMPGDRDIRIADDVLGRRPLFDVVGRSGCKSRPWGPV